MTPDHAPSCSRCRHMTVYGNCAQPVRAGLTQRFMLIRHREGGAGCRAFEPHRTPLEGRVERLFRAGIIGIADRDEALALLRAGRGDELAGLLDQCEAEARRWR